jgi:NAD(P)-dependent dehydrogenase (short-subunit alcohol dehydrogenase family)
MDQLGGKVAVVTGGASGIGFALASAFAGAGMTVVLADVEEVALDERVGELEATGAAVVGIPTDVSDPASVDALAARVFAELGTAHVVCNNAGVGGVGHEAWSGPLESWEWVLGVNVMGVVHGIRAFVPRLLEQDEGAVVNTASLAALLAVPYLSPYTASKHAVLGITETLANELAMLGSKVTAHVLAPGFLRTAIATSERNWPGRLGPPPESEAGAAVHEAVRALVDDGLPPEDLAALTLAAIRSGRFYVTTHPRESAEALLARTASVEGAPPVNPLG